MKAIKRLGLAGLVLALTSCVSIQPKGHIELAYVPNHIEHGKVTKQAFKAELEAGLETDINEHNIYLFGNSITYMTHNEGLSFSPYLQKYGVGLEINKGPLTVFIRHQCDHAVNGRQQDWVEVDGERYVLNAGAETEMGVRYEG